MTPKRLSRKQFLLLAGSSVAAGALAACAPQAAPTQAPAAAPKAEPTKAPAAAEPTKAPAAPTAAPAAKAAVTIDFLAWGDNADIPAWDKLSKDYMAKNPNVTVKVTNIADPGNNFYPKLQTMIAGGTPPDVSSFQGWEWQTYADKNLLLPLDDYIKKSNLMNLYPDGVSSVEVSTQRKGKRYLAPLQMATMVMFYAKKPFQDAGIAFPKDDWTFDQFLEIAKKLTKTDGANKMFGYQANGSWFRDIGWIVSTGKREFDNIVDPKKATFSQADVANMVQVVASDVYNTLKVAPTPADQSGGANTIQTGNCAMKYEGPWFLGQLNSPKLREDKKAVEFDVVLMPQFKDANRTHRGWSEGVALPKTSRSSDPAWDFVAYMAGEEGNRTYSEISGRIPNTAKLVKESWIPRIKEAHGVANGQAFLDAFTKGQIDVVSGIPRSKMWSEVVKPVGWDPLIAGKSKATEVLPKVDEALNKMLDEYWASQK
jgi:multiple sugar transport system substrate-binding protein